MSGSRKQLASDMVDLFRLDDPLTAWQDELTQSQETTIEQMNSMARYFDPMQGVMVLVGDAATVKPMLTEAGIDFVEGTIPE